jgi:antitoxin component of RelBE/YafQ-DinJ toxin-antitoxin module
MNLKFALEQIHAKESERPKLPIKLHQSNKFINKKLTSIYICQETKEKIYKIRDYLKITVDDVIDMLLNDHIYFGASK